MTTMPDEVKQALLLFKTGSPGEQREAETIERYIKEQNALLDFTHSEWKAAESDLDAARQTLRYAALYIQGLIGVVYDHD